MKIDKAYIIIVSITVLCLAPLYANAFFKTDDGIWAVVRLASMHNELRQGQIPVRWSGNLNYGYGYPLFNFSYPAPYYIGQIFNLIGGNYEWSIKLLFITATIVSVIGMYLCAKQLYANSLAAGVAAIIYCVHPYRWINIYLRGSLGEIVAAAAMPFILYAGFQILNTSQKKYILLGACALALLITSHNVLALLFIPFFTAAMIAEIGWKYAKNIQLPYLGKKTALKNDEQVNQRQAKTVFNDIYMLGLMIGGGIAISAFFWLPALYEIKYTKLAITPLTDITVELQKIKYGISSPFDNRAKTDSTIENYYNVFSVLLFIAVGAAALLSYREIKKTNKTLHQRVLIYTALYLCMLISMTQASVWIWKYLPLLNKNDFPWRLNGIIMLIQPLIIAPLALRKSLKYPLITVISLITIISLLYPEKPQTQNMPNEYYATNQATTTSAMEYLNRWIKQPPQEPPANVITERSEEKLHAIKVNKNDSTVKSLTYIAEKDTAVQVNIMYFPGWQLELDGHDHQFTYENGYIQTTLPQGTHTLEIRFTNTPIRNIANIISIIAGIVCAAITINEYRKKEKKQ